MKEVAWIFGNSAAGKETFIRHLTSTENQDILQQLGWAGQKIVASEASIAHIGQYEGDPVTQLRDSILEEVPTLLQLAGVVLVKWQGVDSGALRIQHLRKTLPDINHRVVQIVTPDEKLAERLPLKGWWDEKDDVSQFIAEEHGHIANCITALNGDFLITKINGSSTVDYLVLKP